MAAEQDDAAGAYRELIHYVVASLLDEETEFRVEASQNGSQIDVEIYTPDEVRGRVIGSGGRIARAMRRMTEAADLGVDHKVSVDIVD